MDPALQIQHSSNLTAQDRTKNQSDIGTLKYSPSFMASWGRIFVLGLASVRVNNASGLMVGYIAPVGRRKEEEWYPIIGFTCRNGAPSLALLGGIVPYNWRQ